jgi:hypothetical protein
LKERERSPAPATRGLIPALDRWLCCADAVRPADVIFVVAGRESRKRYALELLRQGIARRLLLSVARFEIRPLSRLPLPAPIDLLQLAQSIPAPQRHFFVLFEASRARVEHIRPGRFGTLTEIEALSRWLTMNPEIRSLLVVSSAAHLRRLRICLRALARPDCEIALIAAPEPDRSEGLVTAMLSATTGGFREVSKIVLYRIVLAFRRLAGQNRSVA